MNRFINNPPKRSANNTKRIWNKLKILLLPCISLKTRTGLKKYFANHINEYGKSKESDYCNFRSIR